MNKEQKTLKSCYILDRLREWFELYGNQNRQRAEEELHLAIDELYEYQQKDRQLADLESKLSESEKQCQQCKHLNKKIELNIKNKLMSELAEKDKTIANIIEDSKTSKELLKKQLAEKEKEIRKKVCDDVIKFMEENGFDCSDWLDLFNLISGRN